MPDLVGRTLVEANDAIAAVAQQSVVLTARDRVQSSIGRHRDQDRMVCSQNIRPGATVTIDIVIELVTTTGQPC